MTKRCELSGRTVQAGNNVSHANNKTRRRFLPNLQQTSLWSETLGEMVRFRVSVHAIRSVEHRGGLDMYLKGTPDSCLSSNARKIKRRIKKIDKIDA
ncbi:MAG: 50S ribosomal protein L28 [Alphaproteobacteria bacterium MarineAlpha3_Bin5]|nr:50S ribosomal protein L28 [Magnetovibrio sp.]PPR78706.1 MAG: 50S ribosomal protein L28 [Alphaproteobacteria bacterium MarineAlpha3_Bin5]|tara:strand:- start:145 stop:435 length:291 start_codon:yes stop_codon:yes gene_type:complete